MKRLILVIISFFISTLNAEEVILKKDGAYRLLSNIHLVNEIKYKEKEVYQALIEVPAGTTAKWEANHKTGHLELEFKNGKPRNIKFLPYPGNYGFIPQTILDKSSGGDGDPLDVIILSSALDMGNIQKIKVLGAIKLLDKGEQDDKIIAIPFDGAFKKIDSLKEMLIKFPRVIEIIRLWFEGYKGEKIQFIGYLNRKKTEELIEKAHISWSKHQNEN